jgi:hypothetical protein
MYRNRTVIFAILGLVFALLVWLIPFIYPYDQAFNMLLEDNIVENLQFVFLLASGLCWLAAFIRSKGDYQILKWHSRRNVVYLFLALLLFFGAGEEISWGQRILGFKTPAFISNNEQGEFNVHNLSQFDSRHAENPFSIRRMFLYFLIVFGTIIPLCAIFSRRLRDWFQTTGIPIVPLIMGGQFIVYYILTKVYAPLGISDEAFHGLLPQIRELQETLMLLLIAFNVWLSQRQPVYSTEPLPATAPSLSNVVSADAS